MQTTIFAIIAIITFIFIVQVFFTESYTATKINLVVIDANGNMSTQSVTSPSLNPIQATSNIVYVDASGNIGVMNPSQIYTAYPNNVKKLLTVDSNNIFSTISTNYFNPCHVNDDRTMNGTPKSDGSCECRNKWSLHTPGDECNMCDGSPNGHTDGTFGSNFAGPDCEYDVSSCNGHGTAINGSNVCQCKSGYAGDKCQFSDAVTCNNHGQARYDGYCNCTAPYTGDYCKDVNCTYGANNCWTENGQFGGPQYNLNCTYKDGTSRVRAADGTKFPTTGGQPIDGVQFKAGCQPQFVCQFC